MAAKRALKVYGKMGVSVFPSFVLLVAVLYGNSPVAGESAHNPALIHMEYEGENGVSLKAEQIKRSLEKHRIGH